MNTITHKNFIGRFNFVEDEEIFHGKIEGITDLVTFEGTSVFEIKQAFIEAVEDYILLCNEVGKDPYKSFKGSFNVRISSDLHRKAALTAARENINLNQFVQKAIETALTHH
jgi:predicted HicB family RNase H-like nuclease